MAGINSVTERASTTSELGEENPTLTSLPGTVFSISSTLFV